MYHIFMYTLYEYIKLKLLDTFEINIVEYCTARLIDLYVKYK